MNIIIENPLTNIWQNVSITPNDMSAQLKQLYNLCRLTCINILNTNNISIDKSVLSNRLVIKNNTSLLIIWTRIAWNITKMETKYSFSNFEPLYHFSPPPKVLYVLCGIIAARYFIAVIIVRYPSETVAYKSFSGHIVAMVSRLSPSRQNRFVSGKMWN